MKKISKFLVLCLSLCCLTLFVGCGPEQKEEKTYTATFYIANEYVSNYYYPYYEYEVVKNVKTQADIVVPGNPQKREEVGPSKLIRSEGYRFIGWSLDQVNVYDKDVPIEIKDNLKFYGLYEQIHYTLTYELNGGSVETNPNYYTYTFKSPDATINITNPTKLGYDFVGWKFTTAGEETTISKKEGQDYIELRTSLQDNLTLKAQWSRVEYTIYYSSDLVPYNERGTLTEKYTIEDEVEIEQNITPNTTEYPQYTGYVFDGWYKSSDFSGSKVTKIERGSTGYVALYAKWIAP